LVSAGSPARDGYDPEDGLQALLRWRLADPAWTPSFPDLLDDVRTCIDPTARPAMLLAALAATVRAEPALGARAQILAHEARRLIAAGHPPQRETAVTVATAAPRPAAPVQLMAGLRP
jgi:hypothetical protein